MSDTKTLPDKLRGVESIFDAALIGLHVLDLNFRYVTFNECVAQGYGLREPDFIGRSVEQELPGPAPQIIEHLPDALAAHAMVEPEIALEGPHSKGLGTGSDELIYLRTAQHLDPQVRLVTVRAGIVVHAGVAYPITDNSMALIIKIADIALYEAKTGRRNRFTSKHLD